jgi:hypothetical protein
MSWCVRRAIRFQNLFCSLHQIDFHFLSDAFLIFVILCVERTSMPFVFFFLCDVALCATSKKCVNYKGKSGATTYNDAC